MDWVPYMSGFFALAGVFVGAMGAVAVEFIRQRAEKSRSIRAAAYQAAMSEWAMRFTEVNRMRKTGEQVVSFPPDDILLLHMLLGKMFLKLEDKNFSREEIAKELTQISDIAYSIYDERHYIHGYQRPHSKQDEQKN